MLVARRMVVLLGVLVILTVAEDVWKHSYRSL